MSAAAAADVTGVDLVALQAWVGLTDQRLDANDTAITGVSLNLGATVGQAKDAMNALVQGVRTELLGFKRQVHTDHQQLNAVVSATQQKFIEVEGTTQQKFVEVEGSVTNVAQILTTRLARAEHQISLLVAEQQRQAAAPPLQTPASTPPQSPRLGPQQRGGTGGAAHFSPWQAPAQPDPWQAPTQQDPWRAGAAAAAQAQATSPPPGMGFRAAPQQFRVDNRAWGQNKNLDLVAAGDAYLVWHDRALGHLSRERPDVRKLLIWAESQTEEMLVANVVAKAEQLGTQDAELVDDLLFEGIKYVIHDSLLTRARACNSSGLELWRRLHSEWEGSAPQLKHAKARKYQDPVRCPGIAALWEALPEWERLGEEVKASGFDMPDWIRISRTMANRPFELT